MPLDVETEVTITALAGVSNLLVAPLVGRVSMSIQLLGTGVLWIKTAAPVTGPGDGFRLGGGQISEASGIGITRSGQPEVYEGAVFYLWIPDGRIDPDTNRSFATAGIRIVQLVTT